MVKGNRLEKNQEKEIREVISNRVHSKGETRRINKIRYQVTKRYVRAGEMECLYKLIRDQDRAIKKQIRESGQITRNNLPWPTSFRLNLTKVAISNL